jgi:glutamate--cysteine ligase
LARFTAMTEASIQAQKQIEASDTMPFEVYRQQYVSAERLGVPAPKAIHA